MPTLKGQSAVETMITVAIALAFILPMVILFLSSTSIKTQVLSQVQAQGVAQQIADTAGEVWYEGNGSRKTLLLHYPDRLLSISLGGDTITDFVGKSIPCPPAYPGVPTGLTGAQLSQVMHDSSREVIVTMDNSPAGVTQVAALTPAMVCNPYLAARPQPLITQSLNYAFGRKPGTGVTAGLVLLVFTNEGDYVNISRQSATTYD